MEEEKSPPERVGLGAFGRDNYPGVRGSLFTAAQLGAVYLPYTAPTGRRLYSGDVSSDASNPRG